MNTMNSCRQFFSIMILCLSGFLAAATGTMAAALVQDGKAGADIVIAENPPRMARLAAVELQTYLEKISGARLPITISADAKLPVHIYIGRSQHTDKLKITDEGLKHGAFRMVSGQDFLVLLGHDADFVPPKYLPSSFNDYQRAKQEWDERTGEHWGNPYSGLRLFRQYNPLAGVSVYDERGSYNAVCEFLRMLGVRWYMPGELGEVVPRMETIPLVQLDKTVRPDFPYRNLGDGAPTFDGGWYDAAMHKLRLGLEPNLAIPGPHGLNDVNGRDEIKQAHPEFYSNHKTPASNDHYYASCLSSPELFAYTVKFARAVFDIYPDLKYVSVWPNDGFTMCHCNMCKDKSTRERGAAGWASDYVWEFTERVARELYKTHPDRIIVNGAYDCYTLPPLKIKKFSPNVMVGIVDQRARFGNDEARGRAMEIRKGYLEKIAPGNFYIYNHYLHKGGVPVYFPHAIAEDLRSLKGVSQGDYIELAQADGARGMHAPGFNHLNVYVTARFYWDADQDIDALLGEYYEKFYGPAAKEMKAFIEFSEANWQRMNNDKAPIDKALELLEAARKAAGDTVYGQRVGLLVEYCQPMHQLREKLAKGRNKDVKFAVASRGKPPAKLDGNLDKPFWKDVPENSMVDLKTGLAPANGITTTFRIAWCDDDSFYFGIRCEEPDIKGLNITSREPDDASVWEGDNIDLMIETQGHSYYQVAIGPSGAITDVDRKTRETLWKSGIQAATHIGENYWSMEVRVPAAGDLADTIDPLTGISGSKPAAENPWYFNLCRQRKRGHDDLQLSVSAPTKSGGFHDLWNFGQLFVK
jgi:hypothetical protein